MIKDLDILNAAQSIQDSIILLTHEYESLEQLNDMFLSTVNELNDENQALRAEVEQLSIKLKEISTALMEAYLTNSK
jgi:chromosome segregation ATPase